MNDMLDRAWKNAKQNANINCSHREGFVLLTDTNQGPDGMNRG